MSDNVGSFRDDEYGTSILFSHSDKFLTERVAAAATSKVYNPDVT